MEYIHSKFSIREKNIELSHLYTELENMTQSPLYGYRVKNNFKPVLGEGNINAKIMIIGEAPGKKEAMTGTPFCGASGKILDALCEHIQITRKDVYITNIVKDRPEDNRDPSQTEINLYGALLDKQLAILQPDIIATVGRFSMVYMMKKMGLADKIAPISELHGSVFYGTLLYGNVALITLYHPAVALYNGSMRDVLKKDFEALTPFI